MAVRAAEVNRADDLQVRALFQEVARQRAEIRRLRIALAGARADLEEQAERYRELFDFAPIGYLVLDGAGLIRSASPAAASLLSYEPTRLVGLPLVAVVAPHDRRRLLDHLRRCRASYGTVTLDLLLPGPHGAIRPAQLVSKRSAIQADGATIFSALVDMQERERAMVERRRIELEREHVERAHAMALAESAAKDRFLAVLSHELRNPLAPILYTVETLERGMVPPERVPGALALIRRNVDLEVRLIDDLLDVSRIAHGKLALERDLVDLHEIVHDIADDATADLRRGVLTLAVELAATRPHVHGDAARLRQVIWNLVTNAVRNTPPRGIVTVRTDDRDDAIAVTVHDTGRGIAADRLETIFRPFDQVESPGRRRGGLGLGLAICKGLVEAHGGRMSATSKGLDRGAAFTVVLPIVNEAEPAMRPISEASPARLRVLVVEDDVDTGDAFRVALEMRGHAVVVARSVAEGLAHGRAGFDVLVSDIGLPDGNGGDVMTALRQRGPIRGIALSGLCTPDGVRDSIAAGFERHLTKPVHLDQLLRAIEALPK